MPDTVIAISNVSKRYLIGEAEQRHETLAGSLIAALKAPIRNARNLARLDARRAAEDAHDILWALRDVSFEVERGEVLGVIGRNGAGKSTLLKILSRITEPTSGWVGIKGRVSSLLEVGTGFHPELTGRDNVYMNGTLLGMTRREVDRKFDEIVAFSEVERFLDTPVKRYSSGMQVRLAFAVAAHLDPEILIIDEVLAVGDHEFQKKCLGKMKDAVAEGGRTVLFVSHNTHAIKSLCSRAVLLRDGRVAADGQVIEVLKDYLGDADQPTDAGIRLFHPDPKLPSQFREAAILDAKHDISASLICDEDWSVRVTYEVRRRDFGGIYLAFFVQNADGVIALFSDVREASPGFDGKLPAGVHTFEIRVPPRTLAPGRYSLTVGSADSDSNQIDYRADCCSFEIHELSSKRSQRPGITGLLLPWERLSQAVPAGVS